MAGLTTKALEVLGVTSQPVKSSNMGLITLGQVVRRLKAKNQTPILCIDEFEDLLKSQEFDSEFFAGLRAIAQDGLSLVIASKQPLINIVSDDVKTSPFFNIFEQIILRPFTELEAATFIQDKSVQAGFDDQERVFFVKYATTYGQNGEKQWLPLRLQLVGRMLSDDEQAARNEVEWRQQLHDVRYQVDFEKRLSEEYQAVVKQV